MLNKPKGVGVGHGLQVLQQSLGASRGVSGGEAKGKTIYQYDVTAEKLSNPSENCEFCPHELVTLKRTPYRTTLAP